MKFLGVLKVLKVLKVLAVHDCRAVHAARMSVRARREVAGHSPGSDPFGGQNSPKVPSATLAAPAWP